MYIIKLEYLLKYYTQYKPENQWFSVNSRAFSHVLFSYFRLSVNCCWKLRIKDKVDKVKDEIEDKAEELKEKFDK